MNAIKALELVTAAHKDGREEICEVYTQYETESLYELIAKITGGDAGIEKHVTVLRGNYQKASDDYLKTRCIEDCKWLATYGEPLYECGNPIPSTLTVHNNLCYGVSYIYKLS